MFQSPEFWDNRTKEDVSNSHTDWLCKYELLDPLIKPLLTKPRATALVIGSGTSNYPERLYDGGIQEVVVVDMSWRAIEAVRGRNKGAGRTGLHYVIGDIAAAQPPALPDPDMRFDLVIDKGTLDVLLVTEEGWERAHRALKWIYDLMKTPATMVYVSHSPPHDRMMMLNSVYWHDIDFKMAKATTVAQMVAYNPYTEKLVEYPYAVAGWEERQAQRRELTHRIGMNKTGPTPAPGFRPAGGAATAAAAQDKEGLAAFMPPQRPNGDLGFAVGTSYVYVLEK